MSEWINFKLGDIGSFTNGINKDKNSFGFGFPFVNLMDIFNKDIIYQKPLGLVNASQDELNRYSIKEGDILFVRSSVKLDGVGKVCAVANNLENTSFSGFIIRFRQSELFIDKIFASYYLNSSPIRRQVISKATLSANSNINQESLKSIQIQLPSLEHQRKIAKVLFATDAVIEQTQSAIAKYKAIKQGLLHDLFTRGLLQDDITYTNSKGQMVELRRNQLRPTYHDAPDLYKQSELGMIPREWEVKRLENCTTYVDYRGKTPPKSDRGIVLVTAKNIRFGYIDYELSKEYIFEYAFENAMSRGKAFIGDVLITTEAPMGNVAQIDKEGIALAQRVIKYQGHTNELNNDFLKLALMSDGFQQTLMSESTGSTALGIKGSRLHKLKILIPQIEEQKEIAKRVKTIDKKIRTEETLLQKYQSIKQGLMGDLLGGRKEVITETPEEIETKGHERN